MRLGFGALGLGALAHILACGAAKPEGTRSYGDDAREAYEAAMEDFNKENCLDAEPAFRSIRHEYPFSRYAALSELRVADCLFIEAKYTEAAQAYRQFARARPSSREVPYARFRVAESYYKQIPDEWFLSPPSYELDQEPTHEALQQMRRFIADYPENTRVGKARRMVRDALRLLSRHELYVAEFYLDRGNPRAAVLRLRALLDSYPGSGIEPQALVLLGRTLLHLRERDRAREAFNRVREEFPRSPYAKQADSFLRQLERAGAD